MSSLTLQQPALATSLPLYRVWGCNNPYNDFLLVPISVVGRYIPLPPSKRKGPRGGVAEPFPQKLYEMLSIMDAENSDADACWRCHGRCFDMQSREIDSVLSRFFKQTKISSFQRQLNLYGFHKVLAGVDKGCYYHPLFLRGRPDLCRFIHRTPIKRLSKQQSSSFPDGKMTNAIPCHSLHDLPYCPANGQDIIPLQHRARNQSDPSSLTFTNHVGGPLLEQGLGTIIVSTKGDHHQEPREPNWFHAEWNSPTNGSDKGRVTPDTVFLSIDNATIDDYEGIIPLFQGSHQSWEHFTNLFDS